MSILSWKPVLRRVSAAALLGLLPCGAAMAGSVGVTDKGIVINGDAMGSFTLGMPSLDLGDKKPQKPVETRMENGRASVRYAGGITLAVAVENGSTVTLQFGGDTAALKSFRLEGLLIPLNYADGGTWKAGNGEAKPFPAEKPAKPFLFQGNAGSFEFADVNGKRIAITLPPYTFQQLQDNREWGWKTFAWWCMIPYNRDQKIQKLAVRFGAGAAEKPVVLVDKFGQTTRKEFPGRVKTEDELKADIAADQAYYDALTPPATDSCGGLPGSGAKLGLKKTGFFHVERQGGRWILVNPEGNAFFHLGICSFGPGEDYTYVTGREGAYEWLPPRDGEFAKAWNPDKFWNAAAASFYKANVIRKFGTFDDAANAARMIERVKKFGFNSVGAFSGGNAVAKEKGFPYVSSLPLGAFTLGPAVPGLRGVFDPFSEKNLAKMDQLFAKSVAERAAEPLLIGYFLENEQGFEDLPRAVPALDAKHACKLRLVAMLKEKYKDIAAFNAAWGMNEPSFDTLAGKGLPVTTKAAFADMQAYCELFLDAYFKSITDTFRKYDKNHMLIGNRWQPGTANNETLCRIAGKYLDVVSINYYTEGVDASFVRRLYKWTGEKPQFWSEFYFTAEKESNVAGRLDVATQKERGQAYRYYVETAASLGFVVGIEWFTLIDQAVTGRFFEKYNGERANTGLFNVCDRPYKPMLEEMMAAHRELYGVWLDGKAPYLFDNPRFAAKAGGATRRVQAGHATGPIMLDGKLDGWPGRPPERIAGDRLSFGRENNGLEAAFKVCWDAENLYLLANITDSTPMLNEREGDRLWSADGLELFIGSEKTGQGGPLLFSDRQILLGAGKAAKTQAFVVNQAAQPAIRTAVVPGVDGKGYTLEAAIPWKALDVTPKEGLELLFDLAVDDSADGKERKCQLMWNGGSRNSSDRGAWGRLRLER